MNTLAQIDSSRHLVSITHYWVNILIAALTWRLFLCWALIMCITRYHNWPWNSPCGTLIHRGLTTNYRLLAILDPQRWNARNAYLANLLRNPLHLSYWRRALQLRLLCLLAWIGRYLLMVNLRIRVVMRSCRERYMLLSNANDVGLMLTINDWDSCSFGIRIRMRTLIRGGKFRLFLIRSCSCYSSVVILQDSMCEGAIDSGLVGIGLRKNRHHLMYLGLAYRVSPSQMLHLLLGL